MSDSQQLPGVFGQFIKVDPSMSLERYADEDGNVQAYDVARQDRIVCKALADIRPGHLWRPFSEVDPRPVSLDSQQAEQSPSAAEHDTILVCLVKRSGEQHHGGQWFASGSSCETPEEILSNFEAQGDRPSEIRWLKVNVPKESIPTVTLPTAAPSLPVR